MKPLFKTSIGLFFLALTLPSQATEWQEKTDTVWAGRYYLTKDGLASGYSETDKAVGWTFDEGTTVTYVVHLPKGHVRGDFVLTAQKSASLNIRVLYPATGKEIVTQQLMTTKGGKQELEFLPDTELEEDGWYRIEITSSNAKETVSQMHYFLFQRESKSNATAANSMMAPAVHLWWSTTDPSAPSGNGYDWVYMEAMIPEALKQSCTYQMTIGMSGGYSGIQTNHILSDDSWTHAVIFSVWDNGDTDKDKNLPDYMRAGAADVGPEAYAVRFGGEGTGSSLRYHEGQRWQTDHWVQMLLNDRPEYVEVNSTDDAGNPVVKTFKSTLQTIWYKQAEETEWHYFGTLRRAGDYRMEGNNSGLYSFLENWSGFGGDRYRRVYYRNMSMRSAASGRWYSLNHAGFSSTQHWDQYRNSRNDYGHGVTSLYDNSLYLESGGQLGVRDSADTYPYVQQGQMPWVDTINTQALRERVDLATTHSNYKDIRMKIEATRTVSDPATWVLDSYSDEEVNEEGDYGRAAQIMDGNTTTYYRQKQWSGFPHTFTFDAKEPTTISSIGLYQAREYTFRAKDMQLLVSDDGSSWRTIGRYTFEDDEFPSIELEEPITARYFRLRFVRGYGNNLLINELYFKHEYRLADMNQLAADLLAKADVFGGYLPEDLQALCSIYDEGRCTDLEALRLAIDKLGQTAQPLNYGLLDKPEHLSSFSAYILHSPKGYGDIVSDASGKLSLTSASVDGALEAYTEPTLVSNLNANWLILRSVDYKEYYLYNLGVHKYLSLASGKVILSDVPEPIGLMTRGTSYYIGSTRAHLIAQPSNGEIPVGSNARNHDGCLFEIRNNYAMTPPEQEIAALLKDAEEALHGDGITESAESQTVVPAGDFDISGRRIATTQDLRPGFYILKGRKVLVK
ncbi:MAG: DUF3472 domain-containing protein [Bacteroidaceae bacterium]|nr:DUF3472 domain-containing protein [Bacteroidaceae bacterium]